MNDLQLNKWVEQLADAIAYELKHEAGDDRACRLQDAQEYVRRAWHALDAQRIDCPCPLLRKGGNGQSSPTVGSDRKNERQQTMSTQKRKFELFQRLMALGFTYDEAVKLRRVEMTLQRWAEMECGDSNNYASTSIERDPETEKPYRVIMPHHLKPSDGTRYPIADREAGALRWLNGLFKGHPELWFYHQGDPRSCALYVGKRSDINGCELDQVYTRGLAVCS